MNYLSRLRILFVLCFFVYLFSINAQPVSNRSDIIIKELTSVNRNSVRVVLDPSTGKLYTLENTGNINRVDFESDGSASLTTVYQNSDHGISGPLGIAFSEDGTLFLVGTETNGQLGVATIMKGIPESPGSDERTWKILARTVEYSYGNTYNHRMSGIIVDPGGEYIYVNSGARTDHGEERDGFREAGLTSIILKLPVDGDSIILQDDREWLRSNGYLMAEGIRNDFDLAFSANGDLFSVENSGDRDDPEEMNWIREGHHYGFPWRIGGNNTPQQFTPYDPTEDPLLSPFAWGGGDLYSTFSNDPDYPDIPDGLLFTDAVKNAGPDADKFRDPETGEIKDASELGVTITTFSTHRSPNGIVFDRDSVLAEDLAGGAFVISMANGNLLQALGDTGEDLLHVDLTKDSDNYTAKITRLVSGFNAPLGIEIVDNKLYILETGLWSNRNNPKLWEVTLPIKGTVDVSQNDEFQNKQFRLYQNYPNPFNPATRISFTIPQTLPVTLTIRNILGEVIAVPIDKATFKAGEHQIDFNAEGLSAGLYFYTLETENFRITKAMVLLK